MNKNKISIAIICVALAVLLGACSDSILEVNESSLSLDNAKSGINYSIPYASDAELELITKGGDSTRLDYRIARKTAIVEFETGYRADLNLPFGVRFSEKPVIIYNSKSQPEMYEFFVLQDNNPVVTVTTYAHKRYPEVIRNVLPFIRDYKPFVTKYAGYQQIDDYYPMNINAGVISKSGDKVSTVVDTNTDQEVQITPVVEEAELTDEEKVAKIYWEIVLENAGKVLAMTDEEIYASLETKGYKYVIKENTYMARKFDNFGHADREPKARTRWSGWCVPSALSQLVWVWGNQKYKGVYLPNVDENGFQKQWKDNNNISIPFVEVLNGPRNNYYISEDMKLSDGSEKYSEDQYYLTLRVRSNSDPNIGFYDFSINLTSRVVPNKGDPLTNKSYIRLLSNSIDNGLYADIVDALDVGNNWMEA